MVDSTVKRLDLRGHNAGQKSRRNRPKVCLICGDAGTAKWTEMRPFAVIRLDGSVHRGVESHVTYRCARHVGTAL